ncbi:TOBE domain-containing protein, partial [Stenotrophomonas maltophilia]|uniref:TOBE domain-containing protein n=1 Tax=Stenotrophomonas maltophilia TaxID=40324 RepID=UPI0013DCADE4
SPRINILPSEADTRGVLSFAGRRIGVAVPGVAGEVRIGIRPEHVSLQADGMACDIRHVEFLGAEVLVYLREPQTGTELIARLSPESWAAQD